MYLFVESLIVWKIIIDTLYEENIYEEFSSVSSLQKYSFSKPITSVFSPLSIMFFPMMLKYPPPPFITTDWSCEVPIL